MNTWEICVRGKSIGQLFCDFVVVFHTLGAIFLIASHNQAHSFIQFYTGITEHLHSIQSFYNRSFIICCSTPVYIIAIPCKRKWLICPSVSFRYNIQVCRNTYDFFAFTHLGITAIIIQIHGLKAKLVCDPKSLFQCFRRCFTKWFSFYWFAFYGRNNYQSF